MMSLTSLCVLMFCQSWVAFVYFTCVNFCHFTLWCQGLAAACDCGTPWTFLLTFKDNASFKYR